MKILLYITILFLFSSTNVLAHGADEPPFVFINGKDTLIYPVYGSSVDELLIPNDIARDKYVVNELIEFQLKAETLPVPQQVIPNAVFSWDFGDGTVRVGLDSTHAYEKKGSYFVSTYIQYPAEWDIKDPVLLQTTLIHIVDTIDYKLPVANLSVNGKHIRDFLIDTITLPLDSTISFDASRSTSTSRITEYFWDFGDSTYRVTAYPTITYKYTISNKKYGLPVAFTTLRIKNADGYIADAYVQLNNSSTKPATEVNTKNISYFFLLLPLVGVGIMTITVISVIKKKNK